MKISFEQKEESGFKPFVLKIQIDTENEAAELHALFSHVKVIENLKFIDYGALKNIIIAAVKPDKRSDWRDHIFNNLNNGLLESFYGP